MRALGRPAIHMSTTLEDAGDSTPASGLLTSRAEREIGPGRAALLKSCRARLTNGLRLAPRRARYRADSAHCRRWQSLAAFDITESSQRPCPTPTQAPPRQDPEDGEPAAFGAPTRTEAESSPAARAPSLTRPSFRQAAVLGPYRTVGLLGQGGMGVVYEAEEMETGRRVALKVLSARAPPRRRLRALSEREGRLAASLNHPHCVFVFGAWDIYGELVIAMELMCATLAGWRRRHESLALDRSRRCPFSTSSPGSMRRRTPASCIAT